MAGGVFSTAKLFGMTIRESANDGSDFTNPDADYRRLFLGEDGVLHVKDSAGTVGHLSGYQYDFASATSDVTVTGTAEASETTLKAGNAVTYDGSTAVWVEYFCPRLSIDPSAAGRGVIVVLYMDATLIGRMGVVLCQDGTADDDVFLARVRTTPTSGSRTYTVKAYKTNASDVVIFYAGSGGTGAQLPAYVNVTKA